MKMSLEHKEKIRASVFRCKERLGYINSPEARAKNARAMLGNRHGFRGGTTRLANGRIQDNSRGGKYIYRVLVEAILGRTLLTRETVHYLDENKGNNALENLFLFRSRSAHTRWHRFIKRRDLNGLILESNIYAQRGV